MVPRRSGDVVSQVVGDEFVVLDAAGRVHALTGPAAVVWRAAEDGGMPAGLSDTLVAAAVEELTELGLLEDGSRISRRAVLSGGVAVGVGLAGVTTLAPPALAAAVSVPTLTYTADGTLTIPAETTVEFSLIGGGGGPGTPDQAFSGGSGGAGAVVSGTIRNPSTFSVTLDVSIGGGGDGISVGGTDDPGASTLSPGGPGGDTGGGGGGASGIVDSAGTVVIAVAGGGGGGASALASPGADGGAAGTTSATTNPPSTTAGGPGGDAGGGGGGGAPGGPGGGELDAGSGGASYFPAAVGGLIIGATAASASSGPGAGGLAGDRFATGATAGQAGQATFTGPGISN
jgi:hypothetical protein